jgi:hypothetical protein
MNNSLPFDQALQQASAAYGYDAPTPGFGADSLLFRQMPAHVYHADRDALSCSLLKPLLVSPAHFQSSLTACEKGTPAKAFGTLLHILLLQPETAGQEVAVFPGVAESRSKAFGEFEALHPGKLVVDEPTFASALRMVPKIAETRFKGRPIQSFLEEAIPEATIYFTEPTTGLRMRVRLDAMHPDISFDLKSTRHANARAFARDAIDMGYDLQAFMYSLARCLYEGTEKAKPFVFIAAESSEPHSVSAFTASEAFVGNGALKFQACAAAFKACTASNYWPDLSAEVELEIEPWQQFSAKAGWQSSLGSI